MAFLKAFNIFNLEATSSKRFDDFNKFLILFKRSPLIGAGLGFSISEPTVVTKQTFAYEIMYFKYLVSYGLIGFSIYATYIFWIAKRMIDFSISNISYSYRLMPLLSGLIAFFSQMQLTLTFQNLIFFGLFLYQ